MGVDLGQSPIKVRNQYLKIPKYRGMIPKIHGTPFPWDDSKNAGFSKANSTWLPVAETANVKVQEEAANSLLKNFKGVDSRTLQWISI